MNPFDFPPIAAALDGTYHLLVALSGVLSSLAPGWGAVLAIVITTIAVRAALVPLGVRQMRAQLARTRVAPALAELKRRHGKNPERLQRETLALYRREGISPFAGMLPALAQIPVISLLYGVFIHPVISGHPNQLLGQTFLGVPFGHSLAAVAASASVWPSVLVGLALCLLLAGIAWLGRRQVLRNAPLPGPDASGSTGAALKIGASLSFVTVVIGAFVPLAAAIYLVISTGWTLVERMIIRRMLTRSPAAS